MQRDQQGHNGRRMSATRSLRLIIAGATMAALSVGAVLSSAGATSAHGTRAALRARTASRSSNAASCSVASDSVAFVGPLKTNPTLEIMAGGFLAGAKQNGFKKGSVLLTDNDDPAQINALGLEALAEHYSAIDIAFTDPSNAVIVHEANRLHVPIIAEHVVVNNAKAVGLDGFVGPNPAQYGAAIARVLGAKAGGTGTIAITEGSFNPSENTAAATFAATIKKLYPKEKVLAPQVEGFDPSAAVAKMVSIIQANPGLVAAYSTTGDGATNWANAAKQTGHKLVVAGMDFTPSNLALVKSGAVYALVAQPLYTENIMVVTELKTLLCGGKVPFNVYLNSPVITSKNVAYYINLDKSIGVS